MFTRKDLLSMDYFNVISEDMYGNWILQSKNTEHCWKIDYDGVGYDLYHKHRIEDDFHYQTGIGTLYDVVLYIVSHDEYQMRGRKVISREEEMRRGSLFFKLIDIYGLSA